MRKKAGLHSLFQHKQAREIAGITHRQRTHFSVAVVFAIFGFLLVAQITTVTDIRQRLETQTPAELGQIIRNLEADKEALRHEISKQSAEVARIALDSQGRAVSVRTAVGAQETLKVAAGATVVQGSGVAISIADPGGTLAPEDLVHITEELRSAGAEALSINRVRLTAVTGISAASRDGDRSIAVSGKPVFQPYRISVIGDSDTISQAMIIPGGFRDSIASLPGVSFTIASASNLTLPRANALTFRYSRTLDESRR